MKKENLERHQVWVYLSAIVCGLGLGSVAPVFAHTGERLLWPALALLMYVTFTQVRLNQLSAAFKDMRFISATLLGNFIILPLVVWAILSLVPADPAIRLGLVLVLLVPCTDWFITFAHQAGGDLRRAIIITPVLLIAQMLLLPVYLWLFMGTAFIEIVSASRMIAVFSIVIVAPLLFAWLTEHWAERSTRRTACVERLAWYPVPLLACVLFLIAASQVSTVQKSLPAIGSIFLACFAFLIAAALLGVAISRAFRLPIPQARTLLFSLSTRNSFVVLPFALALPAAWEMAVIVIVFQSLIELFGMLFLLWFVPRKLLPQR